MAGIQTTYNITPAIGIAGMVADSSRRLDTLSRIAAVACTPGLFVVYSAANKCKPPAASTDITNAGAALGVAMYDATKPPGVYAIGDMVPVIHNGRVYVKVEEDVIEGDPVYVRYTADGSNTTVGAFRKSTDTHAALLPSASFRIGATAGNLAVLELNMP